MKNNELKILINDVFAELKDFQRASVKNVFNAFYKENKKRFLIADEVGLGKTIVAKGLIAEAMQRHLNSRNKHKPFQVIYICSNQALTGQNLKKLNIFKKDEFLQIDRGRLIFQAFKPLNTGVFQLSSLTPSTSFNLVKGTGIEEERELMYLLLSNYQLFTNGRRRNGLKLFMLGSKSEKHIEDWKNKLDRYIITNKNKTRPGIQKEFKQILANTNIDISKGFYKIVKSELNIFDEFASLQKIIIWYSEKLNTTNVKKYQGPVKLIGILRQLLTEICLKYVKADLYILDEFQKFKDLISTNEQQSEAAKIASYVFSQKQSKVLLLSATPFKPYTTFSEAAFDEDHHKDFIDVLKFLFENNEEKLNDFEKHRKAFFDIIRGNEKIDDSLIVKRSNLENLYREVLSRTERLIVSDDKNSLTLDNRITEPINKQDLISYVETDNIIRVLNQEAKKKYAPLIEFCKSAPYPLSFMEQYKVKEELKQLIRKNNKIKQISKKSKNAWLDLNRIMAYKSLGNVSQPGMKQLYKHVINNDLYKLLWMPPNMPYYQGKGYYEKREFDSKVLIFSKWRMVPRAVATIISYESEQRTIGSRKVKFDGNKKYLPDFYENNKKKRQPRKPGKLLSIKLKDGEPQAMNIFSLLYPSITLSDCYNIAENLRSDRGLDLTGLIDDVQSVLRQRFEEAKIEKYVKKSSIDRDWYWIAPILLDKHFHSNETKKWFEEKQYQKTSFCSGKGSNISDNDDNENILVIKSALAHLNKLRDVFLNIDKYSLGQFPHDLFEILAKQVIASPSIVCHRALNHYFLKLPQIDKLNAAIDIASQFHSLFDKPEAIAIVRLSAKDKKTNSSATYYWKEVLDYCCDGNLQSVIDEFANLIYPECNSIDEFKIRIGNAANMRTASLTIDDADSLIGISGKKSLPMRCHYAVDFGNQDMVKEEGVNRMKSILENFNSPFRPFILASTSIGQEGLDFHYYCRKVMHWNLPSNPIDIEQREGRVNRYKGLVVRQNIVKKYRDLIKDFKSITWQSLFEYASEVERKQTNKPELVPFWHVEPDGIHIERIVPLIPFSRDVSIYDNLLNTLALYRLTFGQPRQEELVKTIMKNFSSEEIDVLRQKLMINLSPIRYQK